MCSSDLERIQVVLQRIFALNEVGERNRALQALLGRGWQENIETLKAYANHLQEAIEQAKRFGTFYTAEEAAKAHEFEFQINTLKASLSGLATTIGREVIPAVNGMIQAFFNAQSAMRDSAKASEKWGEDLRAYVGGAVEFVTELITGKTSTWATAFISSGSIFRRELRRLGSSGPSGILLCNFDREENPESGCRRHLRQCAAGDLPENQDHPVFCSAKMTRRED